MCRKAFLVGTLVCVLAGAAAGLTSTGDSPVGALDTVQPALDAVAVLTENSIQATFSEPMLAPGIAAPGNYSLSGLGAGTLTPNPDGVSGGGPYTATWSAGEMQDGQTVTLTATGVQDAVGNPIDLAHNSASAVGVGVAPVFSGLAVDPAQASAGDTVAISFASSEDLDGDPVVTANGNPATVVSSAKATHFACEYLVTAGDAIGFATITISGVDMAANPGSLDNTTALEIVEPEPELPLRWWPIACALLAAGAAVLALRTRKGAALLVLLMLAASVAAAQNPTVSNVAFTQQDNGVGGTEVVITYDLNAPNGPCTISASLSKDAGADGFIHPVTSVTGGLSSVTSGTGHTITWDIATDYPGEDIPNAQLRIMADDGLALFTLTYAAGPGGSISGDSPQSVVEGNDGTAVEALPNTGYHFVDWSDGVLTAVRQDTNVTADIDVTANFAINTYDITCNAVGGGACAADPVTVDHGDTSDITVTPAVGWYVDSVVDSEEGAKSGSYTTTPVTANRTVTATFYLLPAPEVTSFSINSGAALTTDVEVTLDNVAAGSPAEYMASEASDFSGATWQTYDTAPSFTLSSTTGGAKTVYFKVRSAGGESAPVSDTIDLTELTILLPGDVPLTTVWVPGGSFLMGRYAGELGGMSYEDPQHAVTLGYGFWMGKYELTKAQWTAVMGTTPWSGQSYVLEEPNSPAVYVSWNDAQAFITALNGLTGLTFRLPSESEWEYACRAGTTTRFYWGDDLSHTVGDAYCWWRYNATDVGERYAHVVGLKTENAFGLHDMSGNVGEYCEDDAHGDYIGAPADGSAWVDSPRGSHRLARGGHIGSGDTVCRSAFRPYTLPAFASEGYGFRIAR